MLIDSDDLAGSGELAARHGVVNSMISQWRRRPGFPAPVLNLLCGPVYSITAVDDWLKENRTPRVVKMKYVRFVVRDLWKIHNPAWPGERWIVWDRQLNKQDSGPYVTKEFAREQAREAGAFFDEGAVAA